MRPITSRSACCAALMLLTLAGCGVPLASSGQHRGTNGLTMRDAGDWQSYPNAPTARGSAGGVAIGLQLVVVGGSDDAGNRLGAAEGFSAFDHWSQLAAMPTPRAGVAVTDVPYARVLAMGGNAGNQPVNTVEMLSTTTGTWTTMAPMPTARAHAGAASDGVFAYVAGGSANGPSAAVERFDVRDGSWTKIAPLGIAREGCVAARLGRRLVVIGGRTATGATGAVELYDLENGGAWTAGAPMPTPRCDAAIAIYGYTAYVLGGKTDAGESNAVESYDLTTNSWTRRAPLPMPLVGAVASKLGERLVVTGGRSGGHVSNRTWGRPF